jgi:hypothetical protein
MMGDLRIEQSPPPGGPGFYVAKLNVGFQDREKGDRDLLVQQRSQIIA